MESLLGDKYDHYWTSDLWLLLCLPLLRREEVRPVLQMNNLKTLMDRSSVRGLRERWWIGIGIGIGGHPSDSTHVVIRGGGHNATLSVRGSIKSANGVNNSPMKSVSPRNLSSIRRRRRGIH
jgi:hypothetical protein